MTKQQLEEHLNKQSQQLELVKRDYEVVCASLRCANDDLRKAHQLSDRLLTILENGTKEAVFPRRPA